MNTWNSTLMLATRANHDIKMLTNGEGTQDIAFYITSYTAKNQQRSSNTTALLAKSYAFHPKNRDRLNQDYRAVNKRLIERCANTLAREQELSAPEVISYLMGWGDRYISHQFQPLYFSSVISLLKKVWPVLDKPTLVAVLIFHLLITDSVLLLVSFWAMLRSISECSTENESSPAVSEEVRARLFPFCLKMVIKLLIVRQSLLLCSFQKENYI